jgi:hypothetical protein
MSAFGGKAEISPIRYDTIRREAIFKERRSMETLDYPSWRWGLSLIALTLAFHAAFVVIMGIVAVNMRC